MLVLSRKKDESIIVSPADVNLENLDLAKILAAAKAAKAKAKDDKDDDAMQQVVDAVLKTAFAQLGTVEAVVIDIRGDRVRLGWEANSVVPIHRLEVYRTIKEAEAARAAEAAEGDGHA